MPKTREAILRAARKADPENQHKEIADVFRGVVDKVKKETVKEKKS